MQTAQVSDSLLSIQTWLDCHMNSARCASGMNPCNPGLGIHVTADQPGCISTQLIHLISGCNSNSISRFEVRSLHRNPLTMTFQPDDAPPTRRGAWDNEAWRDAAPWTQPATCEPTDSQTSAWSQPPPASVTPGLSRPRGVRGGEGSGSRLSGPTGVQGGKGGRSR